MVAGGCAPHRITLDYYDRPVEPPFKDVEPVLDGSINNVSGYFVIDTGSMRATLTQSAIARCGIDTFPGGGVGMGVGGKIALMEATNVTIRFAKDYAIHWQRIPVFPKMPSDTNALFFGVLGYPTLAERHAVMDTKHKTITLSK
jgi:hypothetical protein